MAMTTNSEVDKFHLFYIEAIMHDSMFPQINRIRPIYENMTLDDFIDMVKKITESGDHEFMQQFLYFLLLFRDMKHLQEYVNSEQFSIPLLEKFFMFTYGYCQIHDHSTERIIDEILYFLDKERLLKLVLQSNYISRDKLLLFFILSKFDTEMLDRYFASITNISEFLNYFLRLPEDVLRSIIARNYHLFQYIMLIMAEGDSQQAFSSSFFSKYKKDIEQFSRLNDIIREIRRKEGFGNDRGLPFSERDMGRISYLVNMVRDLPDPGRAVEYFNGEHVFMDDFEKKIVYAVVTDPFLKNTFEHYDRTFEIQ